MTPNSTMYKNFLLFLSIAATYFLVSRLYPQEISASFVSSQTGVPFVQNYLNEYDAHPQNWAMVQDQRGIMYIGNTAGLLEYDGVTWRVHHPLSGESVVSLAIDKQGVIYIGGRGDFGYLQPDSTGSLVFVSLADRLEEAYRNFGMIWEVCSTTHGIYFRTSRFLCRWDGRKLITWQPQKSFGYLAQVRDEIYVWDRGVGIQTLQGDSLLLIPQGDEFRTKTTYVIIPFTKGKVLLGTRTDGLYIFDGSTITPFKTEADDFLKQAKVYHGVMINTKEPRWALGTTLGGLIVIDHDGRVQQVLNRALGLLDDKVHFVFHDNESGIWISQNNGLSRLEFPSPFSILDQRLSLGGTPHALVKHRGELYVATNLGVFHYDTVSKN